MAWIETYNLSYYDIWGIQWTAKLFTDEFSGSVTDLQGSGEAIVFEFLNESDDVFDPLKPSRVKLSVINDTNFSYDDLYTVEDMQVWVEIYQGEDSADNLYWCGWADPKEFNEPYDVAPNVVSIVCIDGLQLLDNILYAEQDSALDTEYYNGRILESQIMLDVLGKIGFTEFKEFVNLYEEEMADSVADSPMNQIKIDADVFKELYCKEVLQELFKKYNACIRQINGVFCIYRPKEIASTTVYGRYFTDATTKTSVSFTADQFVNRTGHNTNLKQVGGGDKNYTSSISRVTVEQEYTNKESWINNWDFLAKDFDETTQEINGWTTITPTYLVAKHINDLMRNENQGIAISTSNPLEGGGYSQTFGSYSKLSANDVFVISFEFGWYNDSGAPCQDVTNIYVEITQGSYYLKELTDTMAEWTLTPSIISFIPGDVGPAIVAVGFTGWTEFTRNIISMPENGDITIKILGELLYEDVYNCYRFFKFYTSSFKVEQSVIISSGGIRRERQSTFSTAWNKNSMEYTFQLIKTTKKEYTAINSINGIEQTIKTLLGDIVNSNIDNILEQFAGSLARYEGTLSKVAESFDIDHSADYTPGGVNVTHSGNDIIFTAIVAGVNFSGNTTITNTDGDLAGNVVHTQANVTGQTRVDTVTLTGTEGEILITLIDGAGVFSEYCVWNTDLSTTASSFVTAYEAYLATLGITLTSVGAVLYFTGTPDFLGTLIVEDWIEDLHGELSEGTYIPSVARIDTITLTGTSGTADILCDAVTEEAAFNTDLTPTVEWHTRGEDSSDAMNPLLKLVVDEIANQYSRPSQFIQMPIQETSGETTLNLIGNIQDTKNQLGAVNRKFVVNRGTFYARSRRWELDLMEII